MNVCYSWGESFFYIYGYDNVYYSWGQSFFYIYGYYNTFFTVLHPVNLHSAPLKFNLPIIASQNGAIKTSGLDATMSSSHRQTESLMYSRQENEILFILMIIATQP